MKKFLTAAVVSVALSSGAFAQWSDINVNAGSGFTGWTESNSTNNADQVGRFIGASTTSMDTAGSSWGLYANSGTTSASIYTFASTLPVGGYVEIDLSLGSIDTGGTVGFGLQNSGGINRFEAYYIGGNLSDSFKLNDAGGQEDITGPNTSFGNSSWANSQFQTIRFTLGASDTYTLSFDGVAVDNTSLTINASDISQIRIFNFNAGSGGPNNQFFNNLEAVPEPSTYALLALGAAGLGAHLIRRRRR